MVWIQSLMHGNKEENWNPFLDIVCIHCWLLSPIFKSIHKLYQYLVAKCFFGLSLDIEIKILYNSLYNAWIHETNWREQISRANDSCNYEGYMYMFSLSFLFNWKLSEILYILKIQTHTCAHWWLIFQCIQRCMYLIMNFLNVFFLPELHSIHFDCIFNYELFLYDLSI